MKLDGSICALVTPYTRRGELDLEAVQRLLDWHVEAGTDALVLAGSTGESFALDDSELTQLWTRGVERAGGRIRILAGTGASSTARTLRLTRMAADCGVDAALVVTPAYCRPGQDGLISHFLTVADAGALPIVLYNVPTRTACDLHPESVAALASHPQIIGIKEAVADPARIDALVRLGGPEFVVLSGDDPSALSALRRGMRGVISVAANVVPYAFKELCRAAATGQWDLATTIDQRLRPLYRALALESNPIPVKWALATLGWIEPGLRLPLTTLRAEHHTTVRAALDEALAIGSMSVAEPNISILE